MPSFKVKLATVPLEKFENECHLFGPNATKFWDEMKVISFSWADKTLKLISVFAISP